MIAALEESRQVTRVFYPVVHSELLPLRDGSNAAVVEGEPGYQLSTGEIIPVTP